MFLKNSSIGGESRPGAPETQTRRDGPPVAWLYAAVLCALAAGLFWAVSGPLQESYKGRDAQAALAANAKTAGAKQQMAADAEIGKMRARIALLEGERNQLVSRLTQLEEKFTDMTGSLARSPEPRQPEPRQPEQRQPAPLPPIAAAPAHVPAVAPVARSAGAGALPAQPLPPVAAAAPSPAPAAAPAPQQLAAIPPRKRDEPAKMGIDVGTFRAMKDMRARLADIRKLHPDLAGLSGKAFLTEAGAETFEAHLIIGPFGQPEEMIATCSKLKVAGFGGCPSVAFEGQTLEPR